MEQGSSAFEGGDRIDRRPRSEATQFMSEVDRFLTGKSPKCLRL
jgi:hypothetical protein